MKDHFNNKTKFLKITSKRKKIYPHKEVFQMILHFGMYPKDKKNIDHTDNYVNKSFKITQIMLLGVKFFTKIQI